MSENDEITLTDLEIEEDRDFLEHLKADLIDPLGISLASYNKCFREDNLDLKFKTLQKMCFDISSLKEHSSTPFTGDRLFIKYQYHKIPAFSGKYLPFDITSDNGAEYAYNFALNDEFIKSDLLFRVALLSYIVEKSVITNDDVLGFVLGGDYPRTVPYRFVWMNRYLPSDDENYHDYAFDMKVRGHVPNNERLKLIAKEVRSRPDVLMNYGDSRSPEYRRVPKHETEVMIKYVNEAKRSLRPGERMRGGFWQTTLDNLMNDHPEIVYADGDSLRKCYRQAINRRPSSSLHVLEFDDRTGEPRRLSGKKAQDAINHVLMDDSKEPPIPPDNSDVSDSSTNDAGEDGR